MNKAPILLLSISLIIPMTFWGIGSIIRDQSELERKGLVQLKIDEPLDRLSLKITVGTKEGIATFVDSKTTRDFIKLLPLTLLMDDLGKREKYSGISQSLSKEGSIKTTYQKGDISYWLGGGIATFYNQDNHEVKAGLIVLARLEKGIDLFTGPDSINVTFEVIKKK
ncbi:hypothetical protein GO755_03850 [Spirosoma sp. HMF4905]|uniref:Cyclophilin-like domain-containing protein n=1 Tax=Spirosoma arboris TaxID=2682092 RepID=A0A7K1S5T8_9BACT|nr:cyclophilin-like fold protein [Spirosoma arboris]MVM29154.1 hypothetical protein [Spirosoma arboris]